MWTPRARLAALIVAVALIAAACGSSETDIAGSAASPDAAEAANAAELLSFQAERVAGGEFDASSLQGTDTVLWFWAPWCTVCRAEAPDVVTSAEALQGDVQVIGVAGRGEVPEMQAFVEETSTSSLEHIVDADGSVWSDFGVAAQPAFAFIDDSGTVEVFVGSLGEAALTERMQQLSEA